MITTSYHRFRSLVFVTIIIAFLYLLYSKLIANNTSGPPYSLYATLKQQEQKTARKFLESLQLIEAQKNNPKFVLFRQQEGTDFENQAQEILLHHHLALQGNRIYIHQPFEWKSRKEQLPLAAFLLGVTEERSVPSSFAEELCPKGSNDVVRIRVDLSQPDMWKSTINTLQKRKEKCIIVSNPIIDSNFLSSPAGHSVWPLFQKYIARYFRWSTQVLDIVDRTHTHLNLRRHSYSLEGEPYMVLHLRRGDFRKHCKIIAQQQMGFTKWNTLPAISSTTLFPQLNPANATSVMDHCYPSLSRIMEAIDRQAHRKPHIRALHIIHDDAASVTDIWKLETALKSKQRAELYGWPYGPMKSITHSGMVPYQAKEQDFSVGVDVEMARRAEVFIGNGYSSLTSYIVAMRLGGDVVASGISDDITLL